MHERVESNAFVKVRLSSLKAGREKLAQDNSKVSFATCGSKVCHVQQPECFGSETSETVGPKYAGHREKRGKVPLLVAQERWGGGLLTSYNVLNNPPLLACRMLNLLGPWLPGKPQCFRIVFPRKLPRKRFYAALVPHTTTKDSAKVFRRK